MKMKFAVLAIGGVAATAVLFSVFNQRTVFSTQSDPIQSPAAQRTGDIADEGLVAPPPSGQQVATSADGVDSPAEGQAPEFFSEVNADQIDQILLENFLSSRPIKRFRAVTANSDAFRTAIRDVSRDGEVRVHLFDGVELPISTKKGQEYVDGQFSGHATLIAKISNEPAGFAQLMVDPAGMLDASFRSSYGVYKIESLGQSGYHIIWQRDPGASVDTD